MKYLRLVLLVLLTAFIANSSITLADTDSSIRVFVAKSTDTTAKVTVGSKVASAPITFASGASWDNVKDSYLVTPAFARRLVKGKAGISIASDGTASFQAIKKGKK